MKRNLWILTAILFGLSLVTPSFSQDEPKREKKTDRRIDRKTDREAERKEDRRDEVRGRGTEHSERATDRRIDRRTEREGERKAERRDELRGTELKDAAKNQDTPETAVEQKTEGDLTDENSRLRKDLKKSPDAGGDVKILKAKAEKADAIPDSSAE